MSNYQSRTPPRRETQGAQNNQPQQQRTQERASSSNQGFTASQAGAGNQAPAIVMPKQKLFERFGERFGVDTDVLVETLKKTCFRQQRQDAPPVTNEQLVALLIVADQYQLNPFTKEIYAYPDKNGGIVPVVSVDGWIRIIQEHKDYAGMELRMPDEYIQDESKVDAKFKHKKCWEWLEVTIHRSNIERPTVIVEFFDEVYRPPLWISKSNSEGYYVAGPWQTHTKRMMRHKAIIQAGRVAFGFGGIYDDDEADRILEREINVTPAGAAPTTHTAAAKDALKARGNKAPIEGTATRTEAPAAKAAEPAKSAAKATQANKPWEDDEFDIKARAEEIKQADMADPEYWLGRFRAASTPEDLDTAIDACITYYDEVSQEVPIDVEAAYQLKREELNGQG